MKEHVQLPDMSHYNDCHDLMETHKKYHDLRVAATIGLCIFGIFLHGFLGASGLIIVLSFFYSLILIVNSIRATAEKLRPLLIMLIFLVLGIGLQLLNFGVGCLLILIYVMQIPEYKNAQWLMQQTGYPHFDQYTTIQEYGAEEFHSRYDTTDIPENAEMPELKNGERDLENGLPDAVMPTVEGIETLKKPPKRKLPKRAPMPVPDAFAGISPMEKAAPQPIPAAFAGISPLEKPAPLPEPEVPAVDFDIPTEIPDPVWDIPDPVMDTSVITSSFPEIAGDIADLPEIPDIPQI